ncbi:serine/threonine protein kinase, partial [Acidobacteria bacterium AH-259-L09]|nr:serine/threonine protein kinase [Acidobacteria bacterium AH-259-L09]
MEPERWQQIDKLLEAALEREGSRRAAFLEEACAGDEALRQEVESLLVSYEQAGSFMEAPALKVAAKGLVEDQAQSLVGRQIGSYKILSLLGAGGMGQVYRATDTKLGREVAIKVLPDLLARDPERLARFEREAKLLAALNHPNIAAIYGLEESNGLRYLVLELVPGETLAERLAKGPLPVEKALRICGQIAEALEAAHEKGIIHRDLKPANIKVTPQDKVKVLDFGVAKALAGDESGADLGSSSTRTAAETAAETADGVILGTAAYMSPEQARGKAVDKRADIWSFGCVLYEALTAKRAFKGETVTETLPKVLESEPDWEELPGNTSWNIRSLVCRCLHKDPHLRFHDMADVRIEIEETLAEPTSWHALSIWLMAAAAILAIGTAVGFWYVSELGSTRDSSYAGAAANNSVLIRRV